MPAQPHFEIAPAKLQQKNMATDFFQSVAIWAKCKFIFMEVCCFHGRMKPVYGSRWTISRKSIPINVLNMVL